MSDFCFYCESITGPFELDHVVPRSRGGPDHPANIVRACVSCNRAKTDLLPSEWLDRGGNVPSRALEIERTIASRVSVKVRCGRGRQTKEIVAYDHSTDPFERRLAALNSCGCGYYAQDAIHVHDSIETAQAIANGRFGDAVTPALVLDIYRLLEQQRRWRIINDREEPTEE